MAVPGSGTLSLWAIANERVNNDYSSPGLVGTPISLNDLSAGVGAYPPINTQGPLFPDGATPHAMSEFYGYDEDFSSGGGGGGGLVAFTVEFAPDESVCFGGIPLDIYYDQSQGDWFNVPIWSDPAGTIPADNGYYREPGMPWHYIWSDGGWAGEGPCGK